MAKKIPEAVANRLFTNMYICLKCNAKMRAPYEKVKKGKIKCRKCKGHKLRLKAKERRGQKA
ncbi:MAG: 50S ribosomal protein L40e [Candidatus Aenigmarchaeota archaeon]|nr:50S ribosomal protein L40e [Candidatus Aenigmarchaeota archaeon]MDI6722689.1 50S ribosomal protein L40e [Candidatus Aenigmarchaeota archaeon]